MGSEKYIASSARLVCVWRMSSHFFCIFYVRARYVAPIVRCCVSSVLIVSDIFGVCSSLIFDAVADFAWLIFAPDNCDHDDEKCSDVSDDDDQFGFHCLSSWWWGDTYHAAPVSPSQSQSRWCRAVPCLWRIERRLPRDHP